MQTDERDWVEDFGQENGNYLNICAICELPFLGHKRRAECRKCSREWGGKLITERVARPSAARRIRRYAARMK